MVVKAIALSAATTIAAGYLTTLRKQPAKLASYQIISTIVIPIFPMSELAISVCRTSKAWQRRNSEYVIRYYWCAALDQRASARLEGRSSEGSVALRLIACGRWFARLLTLSVFMLQVLLTLSLWSTHLSRQLHGHECTWRLSDFAR